MKTLVLYVYHIYNDRVSHFLNNAIFKDESVDFIVISNIPDDTIPTNLSDDWVIHTYVDTKIDLSCNLPDGLPDYVKFFPRKNVGYDFGGWSDAILTNDLYKQYDRFIFVNSSVMGPFIPSYYQGKWTDIYLNGLQGNIKLFGSTINTCEDPLNKSHVQSYLFSMDRETLQFLIDCEIFSTTNYANTFNDAIWQKEVLMSKKIIENGWNIGSLFDYYTGVDFTFRDKKPWEYDKPFLNDIMNMHSKYMWSKYQLVFVKGNRMGY